MPLHVTGDAPDDAGRVARGLVSGTAWTVIHVLVSVPLAFLVNVVVARALGAEDYGRLAVLTLAVGLATATASMGVGAALLQFATKAAEAGQGEEVRRLVSRAQGYNLLVAAPLVAVVVAVVVEAPWPFIAIAIAFGVFGPALFQVGPIMLASQHRSDRAARLAIVSNVAIQAAVVLTVLVRPSSEAVWAARVIATGSLMVLPFLALPVALRAAALRPGAPFRLPRTFWAFAIPTGLATLLSTLVTDRVQVFFLEWLSDGVTVGLFALAFGLASQILAPLQAAVGPLLPAFTALGHRGGDAARQGLTRVTTISAVLAGAVLSGGVPLLAALIPILYGPPFASAGGYFVVIACSGAVVFTGAGAYASLMSRLQGRTYLVINLLALVATAGLAIGLIPTTAGWGAVASVVGGSLTRALLMWGVEARSYGISRREGLRSFAPVLVSIGVVLAVWFAPTPLLALEDWFRGLVGAVVSAGLFLVLLRLAGLGLAPADRAGLLRHLPGGLRRPAGLVTAALVARSPR